MSHDEAVERPAPIRPDAEGLAAVYWEAVQRERLLLQRCAACGHVWHPPSEFCPSCRSDGFEWIEASGSGVIHSHTVVHHAVHPAVADWLPYTILLVDLHEGPRVIGRLLGADAELGVGAAVQLDFDRYSDLKVPAFVLHDDGGRAKRDAKPDDTTSARRSHQEE